MTVEYPATASASPMIATPVPSTTAVPNIDVLHIYINQKYELAASANLIIVALVVLLIALILLWRWSYFWSTYEFEGGEIGLVGQKIKLKSNYEDRQIAYQLWVELSTRKIGLPIDPNEDVIEEIYNSWYDFFKKCREIIKNIPVSKLRANSNSDQVTQVSIDVLNKELRPHLTKWQAKFRRWYEAAKQDPNNAALSPQEIQRSFPEYNLLIQELADVNGKLINYMKILKRVAYNTK